MYIEMAPDIAQINKLIKFLRGENVAVINISLVALLDVNFDIRFAFIEFIVRTFIHSVIICVLVFLASNMLAVRNVGGLEPLLSLCNSEHLRQRIYAIRILHKITAHPQIAIKMAELHAVETLLTCLTKKSDELREVTCYTIANLAKSGMSRCTVASHLIHVSFSLCL